MKPGGKLRLANTGEHTLKGGRIKRVEKYIADDTFMLTYGDGIADINIDKLLHFHYSHGKIATLTGINPTAQFGELKTDGNQVRSFKEKPNKTETGGLVNGGFFVLNRKIFDYMTEDETCDFEYGALERVAEDDGMMVYRHDGFWACMDNIKRYGTTEPDLE